MTASKPYRLLVINGPNLQLLGRREVGVYGRKSLAEIEEDCHQQARELGAEVVFFQSNHEGRILDFIGEEGWGADGIIINPAALTHTSVGLRDALLAVDKPVIEIHLSNVYRREAFRHHSHIRDVAVGQITGFGPMVYVLAISAAVGHLDALAANV